MSLKDSNSFINVSQDDSANLPRRFSAKEIDVNLINKSLANVNNFSARRQNEKQSTIIMYEITSEGESDYKEMTLRELLNYVNKEAAAIDEIADRKLSRVDSTVDSSQHNLHSIFDTVISGDGSHGPASGKSTVRRDSLNPTVSVDANSVDETSFSAVSELRLRDLRRLDYQFNPNEEKSVLIRRHAVLFAMDPMRAVVMTNRLILIVPPGADSLISILDKYMKEWNPKHQTSSSNLSAMDNPGSSIHQSYTIPFEAHAYEALITTVKSMESQEFANVSNSLQEILGYCSHGSLLPIEIQEKMRNLKNDLSMMVSRVASSRHALHELTEDDEEMALMNLSYLKSRPRLYTYPLASEILSKHDEIEELLESYLLDFNALAASIEYARSQIQSAEELVSLRLDTSRNELLIANTALAVLACSIGFSAYLTGVFGMNLDNTVYLQFVKGGFAGIFGGTFALIPLVFLLICAYLKHSKMLPNGMSFHQPFDTPNKR